ncbi:small secreted protein [Aspergillus avenaceus]|uniref:Small secreted protein n=1 Tax=Aspergillus avenaceus TaxID=36643 RepID=A0A5N6TVS4_ASPAV|nr:small secreted protein [Aspergillus avenaceus]
MVAIKSLAAAVVFGASLATATLEPASSNTQGKCPGTLNCDPAKTSTAIQAAECAYNTRTSETQTFAVFVTDHQYDSSNGAPYGTCKAYTCTAPTSSEMTDSDDDCWTFFWNDNGEDSGVGTSCIKSPDDGTCGCENSDGSFVYGGSNCS